MSEIADLLQQLTAAHNAIPAEDWARTPPSVRAYLAVCHEAIKALSGFLPQLERRVAELEQENAWLKERINTNSGNSSLPPSAEMGSKRFKVRKGKTGRRRGAQPGHPGHSRRLAAVEECRQVVDLHPPICGKCGLALHGDDPEPQRHPVVEIPPPRVEVDEYRLHELTCAGCGARTRAKLPDDVSASGYGAGVAGLRGTHPNDSSKGMFITLAGVQGAEAPAGIGMRGSPRILRRRRPRSLRRPSPRGQRRPL